VDRQADLVVDTTGRTSRTPTWLTEHGYEAPPLEEVEIDLAYSTVYLDRPTGDKRAFFVMPCPPRTRGVGVLPVEDGRWVLTLFGVHGDHPPTDREGLADFVDSLPVDELSTLFAERSVRSAAVAHYPFPSNRRRRYWDLDRFPENFLVLGDAIASFNPIYGQGMSVAALEALQVHHALANGGQRDLAGRVFDRIEPVVDDAWNLAVSADFRFEETSGAKPTGTDLLNRYLGRLTRKAHEDAALADAYSRVVTMERRPTSLLRPRVAWRVLKPSL
jgi:2-polyprenyl-6-methoxyphenol hydroxylase-like FAD-dependent oxidoreductase